jgi:hypothetical protein
LLGVAFGGGWWAAYWNTKELPRSSVAPAIGVDTGAELQIGKDAVVKLYQASPAVTSASDVPAPAPSSPASSSAPQAAAHQVQKPAPSTASNVSPANSQAAKPASTLGKSGKNTFFSEVFE